MQGVLDRRFGRDATGDLTPAARKSFQQTLFLEILKSLSLSGMPSSIRND
jgi:hypothetical protein